jgi:hypothetical protein
MRRFLALIVLAPLLLSAAAPESLKVSDNKRYLTDGEGKPFFYLADTAWELFHRLDEQEAAFYLAKRAQQGFTVIQCVILAEFDGLRVPNANGDLPLVDNDPAKPNATYFRHVDRLVDMMQANGLVAGLLPTWGDKWNQKWGRGPVVFTPENARVYGEFLGRRYRDKPVIWILGGDRPVENDAHRAIVASMAEGLRAGDGGRHLITFHPCGQQQSSQYFHDASWLDFNMSQTGHARNAKNFEFIARDYARVPPKPCLDGEPGYEDHPNGFKSENGWLGQHDARRSAYWAVFSGACGHTYGCHAIWQFWQPGHAPVNFPLTSWREALDLPGANQMRHLRALIESKPYLTRIPDQALLKQAPKEEWRHVAVTSDRTPGGKDATFVMAYFPHNVETVLDTSVLGKPKLRVAWFDPRTGETHDQDVRDNTGELKIAPPGQLHPVDWVLVLTAEE